MTDVMMSLQALLEKSCDTDLLREMIGFAGKRQLITAAWFWPALCGDGLRCGRAGL
jgi:hypothetical protein